VDPLESQGTLFELPPPTLEPVEATPLQRELGQRLPANIWIGAMTWSYPAWKGIVYAQPASEKQLAQHGLTAYSRLPLLRAAEIDRSYYEPLPAETYRRYAEQVPDDFRFLVKAHEDCTVARYPEHARYGKKRGLDNPSFLDARYASHVVSAMRDGLGDKLGAVLFQFSPLFAQAAVGAQRPNAIGPQMFAERLHAFLRALPVDISYAVELRNRELLTPAYGAALADAGAVHCHNAWTYMPSVSEQARLLPKATRRPLVVRWLLRPGETFSDASARYSPFGRLVEEDLPRREEIAHLVARAHRHGVPVLLLVDNKSEGCAPLSVELLAAAIVEELAMQRGAHRVSP
jgi:uncharacterized protein YecE (DUF72 family)